MTRLTVTMVAPVAPFTMDFADQSTAQHWLDVIDTGCEAHVKILDETGKTFAFDTAHVLLLTMEEVANG